MERRPAWKGDKVRCTCLILAPSSPFHLPPGLVQGTLQPAPNVRFPVMRNRAAFIQTQSRGSGEGDRRLAGLPAWPPEPTCPPACLPVCLPDAASPRFPACPGAREQRALRQGLQAVHRPRGLPGVLRGIPGPGDQDLRALRHWLQPGNALPSSLLSARSALQPPMASHCSGAATACDHPLAAVRWPLKHGQVHILPGWLPSRRSRRHMHAVPGAKLWQLFRRRG